MGSHVASSEGLRHSSLGNDSVSEHLVRGLIEYTCSSGNCRALQQALVSRPDDSQPPSGPALKQTKNPPATGEKSSKSTTSCTKRRFASAENTPPSLGFDFQEHEDFVVAYQSPIVRPNCASQFRRKVDGLAARICGSLKIHPPLPPRASTLGNRVARSFLASPIESLDGQSPLDSSNAEVFTDQSPPNVAIASRDVVTPSTSCFLVKESLKHRLRPSQRIPRVDRIARPDMDRYVLRHPAHPDLRDRLLMGKPRESQAEHNLPQSLAGSANNPFRRSGNARRVNASGERVTTGRNDRRNSIRDSNALEHHQQLFASINQPFDLPNPWNRAVFSGVGSRDHNWPGQSVAFSAVPTFFPSFLKTVSAEDDCKTYEDRLALACDVDRTKHLMSPQSRSAKHQDSLTVHRVSDEEAPVWRDNAWLSQSMSSILDAPNLRDDFYCSILAYSHTANRLAVGLGARVYFWSESSGVVETPKELKAPNMGMTYVTSLAFSSERGGRAILATGRADRSLVLYSPLDDTEPRYLRMVLPHAPAHVCFRPTTTRRPSQRQAEYIAENEVLLLGDETGTVSVFFIEWPRSKERFLFGWHGSIVLHAKVATHTQQICGIVWSPDGAWFATGGNDNLCCLFNGRTILDADQQCHTTVLRVHSDQARNVFIDVGPNSPRTDPPLGFSHVKHSWRINAAVKAMAFCPWQSGLIALGGGSNDRRIHFYHTISGTCLARIDCAAQVTSLVWSRTRREIAATLGFAQPDHAVRIVVYAWPSCEQVVAIPWRDDMRALYAIPYPGGPDLDRAGCEGGTWGPRTREEGCIVVAASDMSVKFHEIWCRARKGVRPRHGSLCGSDILEGLHGIEKDGLDTIR